VFRGWLKWLRHGLLVVGLALLALMTASFFFTAQLTHRGSWQSTTVCVSRGTIVFEVHSSDPIWRLDGGFYSWRGPSRLPQGPLTHPTRNWAGATQEGNFTWTTIALWMPAAICLAWPVAAWVVALRRRARRGFDVIPPAAAGTGAGA
jgi:hypothetical protein